MRNPKYGILMFMAMCLMAFNDDGCQDPPNTGASTVREMEQTETNQQRLAQAVPPPVLHDSQERRNLVRRLELVNNPDRISYIHLLTNDGRIVAYFTVRGKVSSLNSLLTTPQQVVTLPCRGEGMRCQHVLPSPDFDGSYGENPHGIFWFDTSNVYHEWNGVYLLSDQPLRLTQEPVLVQEVDSHGNAVH